MSYRFNSSNIIYICSIKQIERIVFEKPNEKNYNKYNIILSIMRRQVYKKVIEIAPDLKRQIAMEMGCTVDTVYNALNLSNPTTQDPPSGYGIGRQGEPKNPLDQLLTPQPLVRTKTAGKKRSYYKPQRSLPPHRASAQCFARITLTDKKRGAIGRGGISRNTKRKREIFPFPLIFYKRPADGNLPPNPNA